MQQSCIEIYRAVARINDLNMRSLMLIRSSPLCIMCLQLGRCRKVEARQGHTCRKQLAII